MREYLSFTGTCMIRHAGLEDLEEITKVESVCFPAAEAAGIQTFAERLRFFPAHFWVMEEEGRISGFINGMVTDSTVIEDRMFEDASLHCESGSWQSVFGLDVLPRLRRGGRAARLMEELVESARREGRRGCILTCKEELISYYERFGYTHGGISASVHGGAVWHDMILRF